MVLILFSGLKMYMVSLIFCLVVVKSDYYAVWKYSFG
jgi:hypothetical protein